MPEKVSFNAQKRSAVGKKAKAMRNGVSVLANVSGYVEKPVPLIINRNEFQRLYTKVGDTGLVYLHLDDEKEERPVLVSDIQKDPVSGSLIHVVFRQVNLSEKVTAEVPVEVVGETEIKNTVVVTVHDAISVSALPQDLPEKFVINAADLKEVGQMITFEQLSYDKSKVTLDVPAEQLSTPVVMLQEVKEEVVGVVPAATETPTEGAAATTLTEGAGAEAKPAAEKKEEKK